MANIKNFGLTGAAGDLQLGKAGPRIINSSGTFTLKAANGSSDAPVTHGQMTLASTTSAIVLNASAGTANQLLASAGAGATPTWTGAPTISGANITGIPNGALTNSSFTLGSTSISLGSTTTTVAGLASVTSTSFTGALTGAASSNVLKAGDSMSSAANLTFSGGGEVLGLPASPSTSGSATSKAYVDSVLTGLSWKNAVRAATTANGTLATAFANGQTIDGITLATNDRILIKNQTTQTENGIYIVQASGAPVRSTDADTGAELVNATVYVDQGTVNADTGWTQTANAPITIGSTNIVWVQFSGSNTYVGGSGITITGNSIALTSNSVTIGSTSVALGATVTSFSGLTSLTSTALVATTGGLTLSSTTSPLILNASAGTANQLLASAGAGATPTWTSAPTISGANITSIPNGALTNSSFTLGSTSIALGSTTTTVAGMASLTSTALVAGTGGLTLSSTTSPLILNASAGTSGQVLISGGASTTPSWTSSPTITGGNITGILLNNIAAATGSATINSANNPIRWNWTQTTASQTGFYIGENTASTTGAGAQYLHTVATLASSTANPFLVQTRGSDTLNITRTGDFTVTAATGTVGSGTTGSAVSLTAGAAAATASAAGGAVTLLAGAGSATTTGGVGGAVSITSGAGGLAATGGGVTITAGQGGATGTGGTTAIVGGAGGATSGNGGPVNITSGAGTTSGSSGTIAIANGARAGTGAGSNITITANNGVTTGAGGGITLTAGNGASAVGGNITLAPGTGSTVGIVNVTAGSFVIGTGALATTATDGFVYISTSAGTPTGVPTTRTGAQPIHVDTSNNLMYFYSGGAWRATNAGSGTTVTLNNVQAAAGSATIANGNNPIRWNWAQSTASQTGFYIGETTASTSGAGAQYLQTIATLATSTANPLLVQTRGVDTLNISRTGDFTLTALNGTAGSGTTGSAVSIAAGQGASTSAGGAITITSGAGGATSGTNGAITIAGGAVTSGAGAAINITASNGATSGAGGTITLTAGDGVSAVGGNIVLDPGTGSTVGIVNVPTGSFVIGTAAIATTATDGFVYISTSAGTPTGVPTTRTGGAAIHIDTTNNLFYYYSSSAWRQAGSQSGDIKSMRATVPLNANGATTIGTLPANAIVLRVKVNVTVADTAATLTVGGSVSGAAAFMATTENDPQTIGLYLAELYSTPAASQTVSATVAATGATASASCTVMVEYALA